MISGGSESGKTHLCVQMLINRKQVFAEPITKLHLWYIVYNAELYDALRKSFGAENFYAHKGAFSMQHAESLGLLNRGANAPHIALMLDDELDSLLHDRSGYLLATLQCHHSGLRGVFSGAHP